MCELGHTCAHSIACDVWVGEFLEPWLFRVLLSVHRFKERHINSPKRLHRGAPKCLKFYMSELVAAVLRIPSYLCMFCELGYMSVQTLLSDAVWPQLVHHHFNNMLKLAEKEIPNVRIMTCICQPRCSVATLLRTKMCILSWNGKLRVIDLKASFAIQGLVKK